jgi:hypothetical protein
VSRASHAASMVAASVATSVVMGLLPAKLNSVAGHRQASARFANPPIATWPQAQPGLWLIGPLTFFPAAYRNFTQARPLAPSPLGDHNHAIRTALGRAEGTARHAGTRTSMHNDPEGSTTSRNDHPADAALPGSLIQRLALGGVALSAIALLAACGSDGGGGVSSNPAPSSTPRRHPPPAPARRRPPRRRPRQPPPSSRRNTTARPAPRSMARSPPGRWARPVPG